MDGSSNDAACSSEEMSDVDEYQSSENDESSCILDSDDGDDHEYSTEEDESSESEEEEEGAPSKAETMEKLLSREPLYPGARASYHQISHQFVHLVNKHRLSNRKANVVLMAMNLFVPQGVNLVGSAKLIKQAVLNEGKVDKKPCCTRCKKELESDTSVCLSEICQPGRKRPLPAIDFEMLAISPSEKIRKANDKAPLVTSEAAGGNIVVSDDDEDQVEDFAGMEPEKGSNPLPSAGVKNSLQASAAQITASTSSVGRKNVKPTKGAEYQWKVEGRMQEPRFVDLSPVILDQALRVMDSAHVRYLKKKKAIEEEEVVRKREMSSAEATTSKTGKNMKKQTDPKNYRFRKPLVAGFNYCIEEEFGAEKLLTLTYDSSSKKVKNPTGKIPLTDKEKDLVAAYTGYLTKYLKQKIAIGEWFHLYTFDTDSKLFNTLCNGKRSARALSIKMAQKKKGQQGQQVNAGE